MNSLAINSRIIIIKTASFAKIKYVPKAGTITISTGHNDAINRLFVLFISSKAIKDDKVPNITSKASIGENILAIAQPKTRPGINLLL